MVDEIRVNEEMVNKFWLLDGSGDPAVDPDLDDVEVNFSRATAPITQAYEIITVDAATGEYGVKFTPIQTGLLTSKVRHPVYLYAGTGYEQRVVTKLAENITLQQLGPGDLRQTIKVVDSGSGDPIVGAYVTVYDETGNTMVAFAYTTSGGETPELMLYAGTYQVYTSKIGQYVFNNPTAIVVSSDQQTHEIEGDLFSPTQPPSPNTCMVYGWEVDGEGQPLDVLVRAQVIAPDYFLEENPHVVRGPIDVRSDPDNGGYWEMALTRSIEYVDGVALYNFNVAGWDQGNYAIPDQASIAFRDLVQGGA
jgi:hypothetical protein